MHKQEGYPGYSTRWKLDNLLYTHKLFVTWKLETAWKHVDCLPARHMLLRPVFHSFTTHALILEKDFLLQLEVSWEKKPRDLTKNVALEHAPIWLARQLARWRIWLLAWVNQLFFQLPDFLHPRTLMEVSPLKEERAQWNSSYPSSLSTNRICEFISEAQATFEDNDPQIKSTSDLWHIFLAIRMP